MANLLTRLSRKRSLPAYGYPYGYAETPRTWDPMVNPQPRIEGDAHDLIDSVLKSYGPVPAAIYARQLLIGQFRPQWRSEVDGNLFGDQTLAPLERPQFTTRSQLFRRAEAEVSLTGTAYFYKTRHPLTGEEGVRIMPSVKTRIVVGSARLAELRPGDRLTPSDIPDAYVMGYIYDPQGTFELLPDGRVPDTWATFSPEEMVHWAPEPDPATLFGGLSWVVSILHDIIQDKHVQKHIDMFLERGAVPGLAVIWPKYSQNDMAPPNEADMMNMQQVVSRYHSGVEGRGRALVLSGGPQVMPVGAQLNSMELKTLTGGYEARIASRARIPASVLGIREEHSAGLMQGNFQASRRQWGDTWATPTLEDLAQALEPLIPNRPPAAELWYQRSEVGFFQEDAEDAAKIAQTNANAVRTLIDVGFEPDAAVAMVDTGDVSALAGNHTGLPSVQLQPNEAVPATESDEPEETDEE